VARLRTTRSTVSAPKPPAARESSRRSRVCVHNTILGRLGKYGPRVKSQAKSVLQNRAMTAWHARPRWSLRLLASRLVVFPLPPFRA
jgi:hypothetical protein